MRTIALCARGSTCAWVEATSSRGRRRPDDAKSRETWAARGRATSPGSACGGPGTRPDLAAGPCKTAARQGSTAYVHVFNIIQ